ncbi:MAG: hypothetical protein CMN05_15495 [Roseibacillus sp.]|nr:hypothetical protein [Roseibacillus sp.]
MIDEVGLKLEKHSHAGSNADQLMRSSIIVASFLLPGFSFVPVVAGELSSEQVEFFEKKIRPVLAENCYECHNSIDKKKGDLALDWREPLAESEIIVPGSPEESPLINAIRHDDDFEAMPSKQPKLAKLIIKNFEDWIRMGAPDPRASKPTKEELASQVDWEEVRDKRAEWWSFRPVVKKAPPEASATEWNRTAIDRFIFAGLQDKELEPQAMAGPSTLVRRLHLILTGLPPRPAVVEAFVRDPSEEAYEKMVDDLMASEAYGERWGRYWLDWFRYAESYGSEGDPNVPYAQQYRDYVIRALNRDVPYDQLLREAVAGDLLSNPRINKEKGLNESAIGPAHLRMVPHGFGVTDAYDEQITFTDNAVDVLTKATLGLTVSCARCHNHKFDPVSQEDYYKFYGMLVSSRPAIVNVDSPRLRDLHKEELRGLKDRIRAALADYWMGQVDGAIGKLGGDKLDKISETDPLAGWARLRDRPPQDLERELAAMQKRHEEGLAHNNKVKENATFYADLREQTDYDQWFRSGNGLGDAVSPAGSFAVAPEGGRALKGIYPAGVYSHLLSDKHSATLSSVFHLAKGGRNSIRAMGEGSIARFTMRSYPLMHGGLHPAPGLRPQASWINLNKYKYWNGEKGYYQINTSADSTFRNGGDTRSWFGVYEVYAGDEAMRELGAPMVALPGDMSSIRDRNSLEQFYRGSLASALTGWRNGKLGDAQALLLNSMMNRGFLPGEVAGLPGELKVLVERYRKLEAEIRNPVRAPGVMDGEPWDQPLLNRGNYKKEMDPVERGFLEVFGGRTYTGTGSGRLELAEDLVRNDNTLTTRVIVNRLWHHTFGRGLVASADNLGRLGSEPSHPDLLDYLATDFRENGWSMKGIVRQLVMSRVFRSASTVPAANVGKDDVNVQLAYYTPRRLDAEAVLDTIRFVAANEAGQRAVYTGQKRNGLNRFLSAFNYPVPTTTVGVRNMTNVPVQALMLMNGDATRQAAQQWSVRVKGDPALKSDRERIRSFFMQAYARPASEEEIRACLDYLSGKASDELPRLIKEQEVMNRTLSVLKKDRKKVIAPVRARLQAEVDLRNEEQKKKGEVKVDLKPLARWDFDENPRDAVGGMHGQVKGAAKVLDGALFLRGGGVWTKPLPRDLREFTLEVQVQLDNGSQAGGGAMTVQTTDGKVFDGVVYSEVSPRIWLTGSEGHKRTAPFGGEADQEVDKRPVRMVMVYKADGSTIAYRDGKPYGEAINKGRIDYKKGRSQVVFGVRHGTGPGGGDRVLTGRIFEARLYDRALTPEEVAAASSGMLLEVVTGELLAKSIDANQKAALAQFDSRIAVLEKQLGSLDRDIASRREALNAGGDPYFKIAHALLNSKELIYVY